MSIINCDKTLFSTDSDGHTCDSRILRSAICKAENVAVLLQFHVQVNQSCSIINIQGFRTLALLINVKKRFT